MAKDDQAAKPGRQKACCLVSQMLDEMGLDARKAREVRRQALLGLITFCQWQLARMDEGSAFAKSEGPRKTKGRRVPVV